MSPKLLNILLVLTPLVLYFGAIDPMYSGAPGLIWTPASSIPALKATNVQYSNTINQIAKVEEEARAMSKDYTSIPEEVKTKISTLLPDTIDPIKLRNEIITVASKEGVAIEGLSVTLDQKTGGKPLGNYLITFNVRTRYPIFKRLMENLESTTRLFVIENVSIKRIGQQDYDLKASQIDNQENLIISVTSRVYFLK